MIASSPEFEQLVELNKKMGVVIALLLRSVSRNTEILALKDQLAILDGLGVRPVDIAVIVGRTPSHVNKELVAIRRSTKK
ncbi:MAG: hypothetical protein M3Y21_03955 [Candidatus Eremiobacteraeota bacterium]|nr:hypothetical protein [Candidatus Eremiobacteraeota bacterium]